MSKARSLCNLLRCTCMLYAVPHQRLYHTHTHTHDNSSSTSSELETAQVNHHSQNVNYTRLPIRCCDESVAGACASSARVLSSCDCIKWGSPHVCPPLRILYCERPRTHRQERDKLIKYFKHADCPLPLAKASGEFVWHGNTKTETLEALTRAFGT